MQTCGSLPSSPLIEAEDPVRVKANFPEEGALHSPLPLPITLTTACIMTLFYLVLTIHVVRGRWHHRVSLGDGDNADLRVRVRVHGNFAEYVPLALILTGTLEASKANPIGLIVASILLVLIRLSHVLGIRRKAPNIFRVVGAGGTVLLLTVLAAWGLLLVFTA